MSWWVGKDRDAFGVALKEHTDRIMRSGGRPKSAPSAVPPEPPVDAPLAPPASEPIPAPIVPQTPSAPEAEPVSATPAPSMRRPSQPWRPGSRGRIPKAVRGRLALAVECRAAIDATDEAQADPALGRAAIIMLCGFLLGQRRDWIDRWTGFGRAEVTRTAQRLHRAGIWRDDRTIACRWLDIYLGPRRVSKRDRWEADVAFWLDALVAQGELTRETRDGQFYYGLSEWAR